MALRHRPALVWFAVVLFLHFLATNVYPAIWAYYTSYRYGWSEWEIGISLALFGVITAIVQGGMVGPFIKRFGERMAALISLAVECIIAVGYGLAGKGWMIYALLVVGALQGIALPAINALMSHRVDEDAQGELQGAISSLMGISSIFGPVLASQLFGAFAGQGAAIELPGMPFYVAAALCGLAFLIFLRMPQAEK